MHIIMYKLFHSDNRTPNQGLFSGWTLRDSPETMQCSALAWNEPTIWYQEPKMAFKVPLSCSLKSYRSWGVHMVRRRSRFHRRGLSGTQDKHWNVSEQRSSPTGLCHGSVYSAADWAQLDFPNCKLLRQTVCDRVCVCVCVMLYYVYFCTELYQHI